MENIKKFLLSPGFCFFMLAAGTIYGAVLPWMWGNDPFDEFGTLSILCEDRKIFFWIFVILVGGSYVLNFFYMFNKYKDNSKFLRVLSVIAFIACCCIALSLKHDVHSWNTKRILHWIATGIYMGLLGLTPFIFLLKNMKRYNGFGIMALMPVVLVLAIVVWLFTLGKSAMMEVIPNFVFQIMLCLLNFTKIFKPKENQKVKQIN